jgi:rhodanese-related sulfurtransferase
MRTILLIAALGAGAGCSKSAADKVSKTEVQAAKLNFITVDDVDAHLATGAAQAVDANGIDTRKHEGVVPGAVMLTSSSDYALTELPSNKAKELVFYCANPHCSASHEAAERAITAGYSNVKVMPEGIAGWVKAGKKVQNI